MGIVINRALDLSFDDIFEHLDIENFPHHHDQPILAGGPVQTDRGFVLHRHNAVSYTHLRAHETVLDLVCRLLLEQKKKHHSNELYYLLTRTSSTSDNRPDH